MGRRSISLACLSAGLLWLSPPLADQAAAEPLDEPVLIEFHFKPVAGLQIAVWLEDDKGNHVADVFVTQATGKLGIGNRAGLWNFVGSWRAPYGPRPMVMPVWAHSRGKTYPKLIFYDEDPADLESLGWHENSSSPEPYFCRPLKPEEHDVISTDTMTCPSPAVFQTDKGQYHPNALSFYPPRNDLWEYEAAHDSPEAMEFSALNDLDAVTGATPSGGTAVFKTVMLDDLPAGDLVARIEVSLEHDENTNYQFDREDHFIDPRLPAYGVEYFGQPSVVYEVPFDPRAKKFQGTSNYAGYGEWDGSSGTLYPPDATISTNGGSGADRLREYTLNGETFRFGVFSHGVDDPVDPTGGGTGGDTDTTGGGTSDSGGDTGGASTTGGGWGECYIVDLPPPTDVEIRPMNFDEVQVQFRVPDMATNVDLMGAQIFYRVGEEPLTEENLAQGVETYCDAELIPGEVASCPVDELFGNTTYQMAIRYQDGCNNFSGVAGDEIKTPAQEFAQVDGFCFIATAAYGGQWAAEVNALRAFRDRYLKPNGFGLAFVKFYYAHGPLFAKAISGKPWARAAVRTILQPVADLARVSAYTPPR